MRAAVARNIDVVLVDPRSRDEKYKNAVDVVMGTYETMQRKILESEMRDVYFESLGSGALDRLGPSETEAVERRASELRTFISDLPRTKLAYMRPKTNLPVGFASFDEQGKVDDAFAVATPKAGRASRPTPGRAFACRRDAVTRHVTRRNDT